MELIHEITSETEKMYRDFAQALDKAGLDGSDRYYTTDNCEIAYFKIPKPFKKEQDSDPDFHHIFIDVEQKQGAVEYSVHGSFCHEHTPSIDYAIGLCQRLYSGEVVEVAFYSGSYFATTFVKSAGAPEENIKVLSESFEAVKDALLTPMIQDGKGHLHVVFPATKEFHLLSKRTNEFQINGIKTYFMSSVLAEHPEYYIVE